MIRRRPNPVPLFVRAIKVAALVIAGLIVAHWLTAGATTITGREVPDGPTYAERYTDRLIDTHECEPSSESLPNAAIVKYREATLPTYTTDADEVDAAFTWALGNHLNKRITGVTPLLCANP